ncbi:MAG: tetratricopeptide repeat protein [Acidobacteria bacterium]|nr:tetratricopeptide repeat protein [Acidobacteriota bacterium]MYH24791.1 tetratricopeptide repeat protein [Holophagales bacterium]
MNAVRRLAAALVTVLAGGACMTTAIVEPPPQVAELEAGIRSFLREPLLGYEGNIPEQSRDELAGASEALARGEVKVARGSAETLLDIDPTLLPAAVLLAQTHLAAGEVEQAVDSLATLLAAHPGYTAGQLVYARAAERTGDAVAAYRAYRGIAALDDVAAERAAALEDEAIRELGGRIAAALDAGGVSDAAAALEVLREWAPGETAAVDLGRRLARTRGDTGAELAAIRELVAAGDAPLEVLHRQAALELEAGDARRGLELYEQLAQRHPGNSEIAAGLTAARFTWRTRLLPENVRELFEASSLLRGDFAALTAWLVPGVRTGPAGGTVIVSDILEHPHRREIAWLLNLGLMEPVDAAVRRFAPDNYMRRGPALATLLRMPGRIGGGAACVGEAGGPAAEDLDAVCEAALRCRLIPEPEACRPERAITGPEAVEALRRTLHLIQ